MEILIVTCSLFLLFGPAVGAPYTGPNEEDLSPCTAKRVATGLQVMCFNFNDSRSLEKACNILRDYRVNKFLLHNLYITDVLPSNLFDGLKVKELRIEKSRLKFSQPAFTGLDQSLFVLNVAQHSMIKSNEEFSLARLSKLIELNIKSNPLGAIRDEWLNGKIPNVQSVTLDEDEIKEIGSNAFAKLSELKKISMADNRIKTVKRSMFPNPALHLYRIDLSQNEIKTLPEDIFTEMPSLRDVILTGNDLQTIEERTWSRVWQNLVLVLLLENKINCNEDIEWIKKFKRPEQLEGNCVSPTYMSGKSISAIYKT